MEQHDLFFLEPVFHQELNITVRNGDKWMKVNLEDEVLIKKTGTEDVIYTGMIVGKALIPFELIPEKWLAEEYDPNCRTLAGLLEYGMKPAYPDFTEDDFVTVLFFVIDPSEFS